MRSQLARIKGVLQHIVSNSMSGSHDGLSQFGLLAERTAHYVEFVTRQLRQNAHFAERHAAIRNWQVTANEIAYDLGANNGDDTAYYLRKGLNVVAVEADPILATRLKSRFQKQILEKRVFVHNYAIVDDNRDEVTFYASLINDMVGSLTKPAVNKSEQVKEIRVPAQRLSALIKEHGDPYFVKIDLEGADSAVLRDLFENNWRPAYISAEAKSIEIFCRLVVAGYNKFKIVEGRFVDSPFFEAKLMTAEGDYFEANFSKHSSGPFGDDIPGPWLGTDDVFKYLATFGVGWKDIHAMR